MSNAFVACPLSSTLILYFTNWPLLLVMSATILLISALTAFASDKSNWKGILTPVALIPDFICWFITFCCCLIAEVSILTVPTLILRFLEMSFNCCWSLFCDFVISKPPVTRIVSLSDKFFAICFNCLLILFCVAVISNPNVNRLLAIL